MRLLFISNYFTPEVNAPAVRLHEHARQWVADGHEVEVLTSIPNFPEGEIYDGYTNKYHREERDGISTMRVPMFVTANEGTVRRTLSYISFMLSAIWYSRKVAKRPDVLVATSPQFFAAIAGYVIARLKQIPFVLEVRDLWPESIIAVGAAKRNWLIRLFERIELYLYQHADHIVVVTESFKRHITERGVSATKISVLKNGFDLRALEEPLDDELLSMLRIQYDLEDKFVASYIGTIGMAHGVQVLVEAARMCEDPSIVFVVMGTGAERAQIEALAKKYRLKNFRLIDKQPRELVRYFLALSDVSVVHLRRSKLFQTVIPSKIFEAMAMKRPIVLGVDGETRDIVRAAGAGVYVEPEDAWALLNGIQFLKEEKEAYAIAAESGCEYVYQHHDRTKLARTYWQILEQIVGIKPMTSDSYHPVAATAGV